MNLTILEPTPSLNVVLNQHWSKKRKEKERWGWLMKEALMNRPQPIKESEFHTHVTVIRYGMRKLDYDNLVGGAKSVLVDNLIAMKLIEDDDPDSVEITYSQVTGTKAKPYRTEITLTTP